MNKYIIFTIFLSAVLIFTACQTQQQQQDYNTPTRQGKVVFAITDAAIDMSSIKNINVVVENISVHNSLDGWVNIPFTPTTYDLIKLKSNDDPIKLTEVQIKEGTYQQVRLAISKVTVVDQTGEHEAKLPSGELKIVGILEVQSGNTAAVTFDFMADESLHMTGDGMYIFAPVVKLEIRKNAVVKQIGSEKMIYISGGEVKTDVKVGMNERGEIGEDKVIPKDAMIRLEANKIMVDESAIDPGRVENSCSLYRNPQTGEYFCAGCGGTVCKDPAPDMIYIERSSDKCVVTAETGCTYVEAVNQDSQQPPAVY